MKQTDIKPGDWMRMFLGESPPEFFIELVIRSFVIFFILMVSMRLFGRRMAAQLNRIEMIALFSLAAAIGVPLQAPDRGLLPAAVIAIVVILVGRWIAGKAFHNQKFESLAEDDYASLVLDGVIVMHRLKRTRLTVERLFAQLRGEGIKHLGEVKRFYFEANGSFSLIKAGEPKPGLPVIPGFDQELMQEQEESNEMVCQRCGHYQVEKEKKCPNCGNEHWVKAVK